MRGLSEVEFANAMKESFVSVWVDPTSGFGTFPLESMKMGIPVIGLTPNLVPEWMNEDNGIWINNVNMLPDVIADVIQNWLEDNLNPELYNEMEKTITKYTDVTNFNNEVIRIFSEMINNRLKNFEDQLSKFITTE
jgi:glycosyltransferase involved in cell wall biosynthesis